MSSIPINKQAALFLTRKRKTSSIPEAIDGAINFLSSGKLLESAGEVFAGQFGPEPKLEFTISIRKDVANPGRYVYTARTTVQHEIGSPFKIYGLSDKRQPQE
jgi:hypothetical protein